VTIVVSILVIEELIRTIKAKKPEILALLHSFLEDSPPEICADPEPLAVRRAGTLIDASDAPILAAALQAQADCIVTGNTRHFTRDVAVRAGIAIFTPSEYVTSLQHTDTPATSI
jgi:predicted nucleic acid-binding protein